MDKLKVVFALVCSLLFAGCFGGKGDSDGSSSPSGTNGPGGNGNGTENMTLEPIVKTGTVSGVQDCTLAGQNQDRVSSVDIAIPPEAANRTWALTFTGGQPSQGGSGCIGFNGAQPTAAATGTIAPGTTTAEIAVNNGQTRTYTLTIT